MGAITSCEWFCDRYNQITAASLGGILFGVGQTALQSYIPSEWSYLLSQEMTFVTAFSCSLLLVNSVFKNTELQENLKIANKTFDKTKLSATCLVTTGVVLLNLFSKHTFQMNYLTQMGYFLVYSGMTTATTGYVYWKKIHHIQTLPQGLL